MASTGIKKIILVYFYADWGIKSSNLYTRTT